MVQDSIDINKFGRNAFLHSDQDEAPRGGNTTEGEEGPESRGSGPDILG